MDTHPFAVDIGACSQEDWNTLVTAAGECTKQRRLSLRQPEPNSITGAKKYG